MTPIFPPRSNTIVKASIPAVFFLLVALTGFAVWWTHTDRFTNVGVTISQPVPFPHSFHIGGLGLNCRYCHAAVDKSSFADLPPTETCMSCHSQVALDKPSLQPVRDSWATGKPIQWNRVNSLPDFVFFNHEIHVNKGVGCETCHGRVDQMLTDVKANTFYMSWCMHCHRYPEKYLRPADQIYTMGYTPAGDQLTIGTQLVQQYNLLPVSQRLDCSTCHR